MSRRLMEILTNLLSFQLSLNKFLKLPISIGIAIKILILKFFFTNNSP